MSSLGGPSRDISMENLSGPSSAQEPQIEGEPTVDPAPADTFDDPGPPPLIDARTGEVVAMDAVQGNMDIPDPEAVRQAGGPQADREDPFPYSTVYGMGGFFGGLVVGGMTVPNNACFMLLIMGGGGSLGACAGCCHACIAANRLERQQADHAAIDRSADYQAILRFYEGLAEIPDAYQDPVSLDLATNPHTIDGDPTNMVVNGSTVQGFINVHGQNQFNHPKSNAQISTSDFKLDLDRLEEMYNYARMNTTEFLNTEGLETATDLEPHYKQLLETATKFGSVELTKDQAELLGVEPGLYPPGGKKHAEVYDTCLQDKFNAAFAEIDKRRNSL